MQDEVALDYFQSLLEGELRATAVSECHQEVAEQDGQVGQSAIFVKEGKYQTNHKKQDKAERDCLP